AKQMYEQAAGVNGAPEDLAALRKIVDQYFITSMGDQAADRLADALFESGDFGGAILLWNSILDSYPDSDLPALRIQIKRGTALARAGQFDALAALIARFRVGASALATMTVGGRVIIAAEYLQTLMAWTTSLP